MELGTILQLLYLTNDECKKVVSDNYSPLQKRVDIVMDYLSVVQNMIKNHNMDFVQECQQAALIG